VNKAVHIVVLFSSAIACTIGIGGYSDRMAQAIVLQDGTVYFAQPPRLTYTGTTYNDIYVSGATYYFTVSLPDNAGEPLQKITINQYEGVDDIEFEVKKTYAFEGTRSKEGQKLQLTDVSRDKKTISLTLNPPVSPGKTITIALKPVQNPTIIGVYLFGVTAFPAGEKSHGQFLGYGRLQFYSHGFSGLFHRP
jgi:hypothetical protein